MNSSCRVLVVDRQAYWLKFATEALMSAGFSVSVSEKYPCELARSAPNSGSSDLVILGCARVGADEQEVITDILSQGYHLLVLCAFLPWKVMRALFLLGVDDVADKPYSAQELVSTVETLVASKLSYDHPETEEVLL